MQDESESLALFGQVGLNRTVPCERGCGHLNAKRMVILEFADMAQLKAWYHSPEDMIDIQSFTWVRGSNEYDEWTADARCALTRY